MSFWTQSDRRGGRGSRGRGNRGRGDRGRGNRGRGRGDRGYHRYQDPEYKHRNEEHTQNEPIISNHFLFHVPKNLEVTQYDVAFDPVISADSKNVRQKLFKNCSEELQKYFIYWSFENTILYAKEKPSDESETKEKPFDDSATKTIKKLPDIPASKTIILQTQNYKISLEKNTVRKLDELEEQAESQILHVILREILQKIGYKKTRHDFYLNPDIQSKNLSYNDSRSHWNKVNLWRGFDVALHNTVNGYHLRIFLHHKIISPFTVLETMQLHNFDKRKCGKELKGTNKKAPERGVVTLYNYRTYTTYRFDWNKNVDSVLDESTKKTFREYYTEKNCGELVKDKKLSTKKGLLECNSQSKNPTYLLPELCYFTGVSLEQSRDVALMRELDRITAIPYNVWLQNAEKLINSINTEFEKQKMDFRVDTKPIEISRKVLKKPPEIARDLEQDVTSGSKIAPSKGFIEQKDTFRILVTADNEETVVAVWDSIEEIIRKKKRYRSVRLYQQAYLLSVDNPEIALNKIMQIEPPIHGVLVVMPHEQESNVYGVVHSWKLKSNEQRHLVFQCIKEMNAMGKRASECLYRCVNNLLLKADWIPWKINWKKENFYDSLQLNKLTMIMGMDVCHNRRAKESVVGFAFTFDSDFVKMRQFVGIQKMGQELVKNIDVYFNNALELFKIKNNKYPEQIFFYRDGVSSSQLETIKAKEISKLDDLMRSKGMDETKLQVIVVQKRLKTRLYSQIGLLPPGTLVDEGITAGFELGEFFLITCRPPPGKNPIPSRFIVLRDDLELTKNSSTLTHLQLFSFHLCDLYFDSVQDAVRIPHVVKMADHISFKFSDHALKETVRERGSICDVSHLQDMLNIEKESEEKE